MKPLVRALGLVRAEAGAQEQAVLHMYAPALTGL